MIFFLHRFSKNSRNLENFFFLLFWKMEKRWRIFFSFFSAVFGKTVEKKKSAFTLAPSYVFQKVLEKYLIFSDVFQKVSEKYLNITFSDTFPKC